MTEMLYTPEEMDGVMPESKEKRLTTAVELSRRVEKVTEEVRKMREDSEKHLRELKAHRGLFG